MNSQVSAFIICCNEEASIARALESIKWCDEIIIVDSGSTDKTLEICKKYTDKIYHRNWTGYVAQKSYALTKCSCAWVLNIDADEEVSPNLAEEIRATLANVKLDVAGFEINRVVYHLGIWWRKGGWYPEFRLRLCRRSVTTWGGKDPHEKATVHGKIQKLHGELLHYSYSSLTDQVARLNSLSFSAAQSQSEDNREFSLLKLIFNPLGRFFKFYLLKGGYQEGVAGLIVAITEAHYVFLKYAKLWELKLRR